MPKVRVAFPWVMLISPGRKHFPRNIIIAIIYMNLHHLHSLCYKKQPSLYSSPQIFLEHGYSGKSLSFSRLCSECLWFGFAIFKNVITLRTCGWVSVPQPWIFFPGETWAALSHDREKCQVSWEKTFWHLLHRLGKKTKHWKDQNSTPFSNTKKCYLKEEAHLHMSCTTG